MLKKYRFTTAWHMTDIDNVVSILKYGLLSLQAVNERNIELREVGWSSIRDTRPEESRDKVLSFVMPYNRFMERRPRNHRQYHPESKGLCLLEIDLEIALKNRLSTCLVSNGILSKKKFHVRVEPIDNLLNVIDWHVMLDPNFERNEENDFYAQAEILLPNPIPVESIRRFWVADQAAHNSVKKLNENLDVRVAAEYFDKCEKLPPPAVENFINYPRLTESRVSHNEFGRGILSGYLGDRFVIDFEACGKQLVPPESFKYA